MAALDLFAHAGVTLPDQQYHWHLHGRYLIRVCNGWPVQVCKRTVYHYDDGTVARTEDEARKHFEQEHGKPDNHHQWQHFYRGREYIEK